MSEEEAPKKKPLYASPFADCDPNSTLIFRTVMENHLRRSQKELEGAKELQDIFQAQGRIQVAKALIKDLGGEEKR